MMNSGHTLNIKFPCNLGISCNNSINLNFCFSEILVSLSHSILFQCSELSNDYLMIIN